MNSLEIIEKEQEISDSIVKRILWEENLTRQEINHFYKNVSFVKKKIWEILFEKYPDAYRFGITLPTSIFKEINSVTESVSDVLENIAEELALDVINIEEWLKSWRIKSEPLKQDDDPYYNFRSLVRDIAYEKLREIYSDELEIREVYIYEDLELSEDIVDLSKEFSLRDLEILKAYSHLDFLYDHKRQQKFFKKYISDHFWKDLVDQDINISYKPVLERSEGIDKLLNKNDLWEKIYSIADKFIKYFVENREFFRERYLYNNDFKFDLLVFNKKITLLT